MHKKETGKVIYKGPSMIDGKPIICVAIYKSKNTKTGNMIQTYILREDIDPREANKTGADYSICGTCKHRGTPSADPSKALADKRSCYVVIGQGPLIVWRSYHKGAYSMAQGHDQIAAIGAGRVVRLGTYGDPAAIPSYIWDSLLRDSKGRTGYSHQAGHNSADFRPDLTMTSADNMEEARAAWDRGQRTFRVISDLLQLDPSREALCPASKEAGQRSDCSKCKLCSGSSLAAKSIAIVAHGAGAKHFEGAA